MSKPTLCDEKYFESFYKTHFQSAINFAFYKNGRQDNSHDLVQEAFSNIWENCSKIDFTKAKSYLFTSIQNLYLNRIKHQKVVFTYQKETPYFDRDNQNPEYILEEKEFKQDLLDRIAALPEKQRVVFLLNRIEDKKYREISEILNISIKTVENRMSLAIKALNVKTKFTK
ncbi:RNA polymerase sigma factor [Wenyingzhuangia sp. IMCC45574]